MPVGHRRPDRLYVAAIPVPEKKNQANYACEMVVKFLKLMRHTQFQFRLRADNEPALNLVVEAIKGVWPRIKRHSTRLPRMARQKEPFKRCVDWQ